MKPTIQSKLLAQTANTSALLALVLELACRNGSDLDEVLARYAEFQDEIARLVSGDTKQGATGHVARALKQAGDFPPARACERN